MHIVYIGDARAGPATHNRFGDVWLAETSKLEFPNVEVLFYSRVSVPNILARAAKANLVICE